MSRCAIAWWAQAGAILLVLGGCATTDTSETAQAGGTDPATAVPANYRQLLARNFAAKTDLSKLRKAEISQPGVWVGPFGLGKPTPIACAVLTIQGPLIQQTYAVGFTFQNGQIADVFSPDASNPAAGGAFAGAMKNAATCGKLSYTPFPELMKPR